METKRFIGSDLARLYERVRREFGPDAAIIGTRTLMREGADPLIELTAAAANVAEEPDFALQRTMIEGALGRLDSFGRPPDGDRPLTIGDIEDMVSRDGVAQQAAEPSGDSFGDGFGPPAWLEGYVQAPAARGAPDGHIGRHGVPADRPTGLGGATHRGAPPSVEPAVPPAGEQPSVLQHPYARREGVPGLIDLSARRAPNTAKLLQETLAEAGFDPAAAAAIAGSIEAVIDPMEAIAAELIGRDVRMPAKGRPALITVEGPEGSGKTTALMRMALDYADEGQEVAVVAADGMHVGAHDQVRAYAEAIGVSWMGTESVEAVEEVFAENRQSRWLLADLPAGPWTPTLIAPEHCYRFLTIPCHWQAEALMRVLAGYDLSIYRGAILTFTDLAADLSPILSLLMESQMGVAFLSSDRDVATGMTPADISALASGIYLTTSRGSTDGRLVGIA